MSKPHPSIKPGCEYQRWITASDMLPIAVNEKGERLCRWCRKVPLKYAHVVHCSEACSNEYSIRSNPSYAARVTASRDRYICRICELDCEKIERIIRCTPPHLHVTQEVLIRGRLISVPSAQQIAQYDEDWADFKKVMEIRDQVLAEYGWAVKLFGDHKPFYEIDHIVPVDEGGGACGIDNLWLLCVPCHKKRTKEQAGRRARQPKKGVGMNQYKRHSRIKGDDMKVIALLFFFLLQVLPATATTSDIGYLVYPTFMDSDDRAKLETKRKNQIDRLEKLVNAGKDQAWHSMHVAGLDSDEHKAFEALVVDYGPWTDAEWILISNIPMLDAERRQEFYDKIAKLEMAEYAEYTQTFYAQELIDALKHRLKMIATAFKLKSAQ